MHQAVVDPIYVNVTTQEIVFRETSGFMASLFKKANTLLGFKYPLFDQSDLSEVLLLARQSQ
jgi:hypothetical protein